MNRKEKAKKFLKEAKDTLPASALEAMSSLREIDEQENERLSEMGEDFVGGNSLRKRAEEVLAAYIEKHPFVTPSPEQVKYMIEMEEKCGGVLCGSYMNKKNKGE